MRALEAARWAMFPLYAVLWTGGVLTACAWTDPPPPAWAGTVFLTLTGLMAWAAAGEIFTPLVFAVGGFLVEVAGVHTGIPFGRYRYTDALGPSLATVPVAIVFAWLTLLLFVRDAAWRFTQRRWIAAGAGAVLMTGMDLLIDPVASRMLGYWRWEQPGQFWGVPLVNFAGWFFMSWILLSAAPPPERRSAALNGLGWSVVAFFALIAAFHA